MELRGFIEAAAALPGLPGYERAVAEHIAGAFGPMVDEVTIDPLYNVVARLGERGPRVMVTAHQDEIALVVLGIEEDGALRVTNIGALPARVLPASEVTVHAAGGPLYGVVGAKPPHLLSAEDRKQAVQMKDLYVDVGMSAEKVRERVRVGDNVTMRAPLVALQGERLAGKTMDDRACVAALLLAAERLSHARCAAQALFVSASQEEPGCRGAAVAAYALRPDIAIAIDVTHAETPDADKWETFPLDKPTIAVGPNMHPGLTKKLMEVADANRVAYSVEPCGHPTGTDARSIQIAGAGVPTLLIGVPLKYMHSSVELIDLTVLREVGRLVGLFIEEISRAGEVDLWN